MMDQLGDPEILGVIASVSGMLLGILGVHLTAPRAFSVLWNAARGRMAALPRRRTVTTPSGSSAAAISSGLAITDEVTAKLSSTDLQARVAILEGELADALTRLKSLHSRQEKLRAGHAELLRRHDLLSAETKEAIDNLSDQQAEIDATGLPVVLAAIILGSWPAAWLNPWTVLPAIGVGVGVAFASWSASRNRRSRCRIG